METIQIGEDLYLRCAQVKTFPQGISEAFDKLMIDFPLSAGRNYYGISWMDEQFKVIYKVAANILKPGDADLPGYDNYVVPSGTYLSETIDNWMQDLPKISETFGKMMATPGFDSTAACVEWYINDDKMVCMARLVDAQPSAAGIK
jgi:hypothetical protein